MFTHKLFRPPLVLSLRAFVFAIFGLIHLSLLTGCASTPNPDDNIKLLTIGNSFTAISLSYLHRFAADDGKSLTLFSAAPGGTTLEAHAKAAKAYAVNPDDPAGRMYRQNQQSFSLVEALKSQHWNYITIQESLGAAGHKDASTESLQTLVDLIRVHAPQAKVLLFEPWSAREQTSPVPDGRTSSQISYESIHAETLRLAAQFNLTVLPVGTAFQNARNTPLWQVKNPDPNFDYTNPAVGSLPDQSGSLIVGWYWNHNTPRKMVIDNIHANPAGCYLAGAVIYEAISGSDIRKNSLSVNDVTSSRAKNLRLIAHTTLAESHSVASAPPAPASTDSTPAASTATPSPMPTTR